MEANDSGKLMSGFFAYFKWTVLLFPFYLSIIFLQKIELSGEEIVYNSPFINYTLFDVLAMLGAMVVVSLYARKLNTNVSFFKWWIISSGLIGVSLFFTKTPIVGQYLVASLITIFLLIILQVIGWSAMDLHRKEQYTPLKRAAMRFLLVFVLIIGHAVFLISNEHVTHLL